MGVKAKVQKFETTNKAQIKGKVGHSRTGACNSKGRCFHGNKPRQK
jgi:hypothetical protein